MGAHVIERERERAEQSRAEQSRAERFRIEILQDADQVATYKNIQFWDP